MFSACIAIFNTKNCAHGVCMRSAWFWTTYNHDCVRRIHRLGLLVQAHCQIVTLGTCSWFMSHWDYAGDNGRRSHVSQTDADCQQPRHHSGSSSTSHGTGGLSKFRGRETHPKAPASTAVHGPSLVGRCSWVIFGWPSIHSWPGRLIYIRSEKRQPKAWACQGVSLILVVNLFHPWWPMCAVSGNPLPALTPGSCKCQNPSVSVLRLTHLGTLVISKFRRIWRCKFSPISSEIWKALGLVEGWWQSPEVFVESDWEIGRPVVAARDTAAESTRWTVPSNSRLPWPRFSVIFLSFKANYRL